LLDESYAAKERLKSEVDRLAGLDRELKIREDRIAALESNLRQRQEEISQAWAEAKSERKAKEQLESEVRKHQERIEELDEKLGETDAWLFKLSGDRRLAEQTSARLEAELSRERELRSSDRSRADVLSKEVEALRRVREFDEGRLEDLQKARELDGDRIEKGHRQLALMLEQLRQREVELAAQKADAEAMAAKLVAAGDDLERLKGETSNLSRAQREKDLIARQKERNLDWLRQVDEVIAASTRGWRGLMPPAWRRQRQLDMLRARGLFDSSSYLERYPDVGEAGMDPLLHYIMHGMAEGRQADINLG
jgi:chromosome segregation ATPase